MFRPFPRSARRSRGADEPPRGPILRAVLGLFAVYAMLAQAFAGTAASADLWREGAAHCAVGAPAPGKPGKSDQATHHQCCIASRACAGGLALAASGQQLEAPRRDIHPAAFTPLRAATPPRLTATFYFARGPPAAA